MTEITRQTVKVAVEIARRAHAKVRRIEERTYEVTGTTGRAFSVKFIKASNGKKIGTCSCGKGTAQESCYHIASALPLHLFLMRQQAMSAR